MTQTIRQTSAQAQLRSRRPSRLRKYFKQGLITLLAFLVAAGLLNQIIPSPTIPPNVVFISPKYEYYQAHKDEYNTLFFGSSRVYNQVVPEVFDQTAQAAGLAVNSFNFGIPALRAVPGYVLLRDVLRDPPANLRWVLIETPLDKGYEPIENARTNPSIYWHTWQNTWFAIQYVLRSDLSLSEKVVIAGSHLVPLTYHYINVGRLFHQWLPITQFSEQEQRVSREVLANEGYFPLDSDEAPKRKRFLEDLAGYRQSVQRLAVAQQQAPAESVSPNQAMLLTRLIEAVEAAGATPIFIIPPTLETQANQYAAYRQGIIPELFAFNDPQQYPSLYALAQRYDVEHVNPAGAEAFTELVARSFIQTVQ
ncbi:MAG: hypothetical protein F6J97_09340 [Leptolyngbya sp. SIO4C1]|nr:hypothetical protein [Leptolyngbya sp. SIO4C1]